LTSLRYGLKHFANEVTRLYDKDGITVADNGKASIADDGKPNGDFASATPSILTEAYVKLARQAGFPVKGPVYPKEILAAIKAADAAAAKAKAAEEAAEGGTDDTTASSDSTEGTDAGTGITPEPAKKVQTKKSGLKGLAALRAKKAGANK
jgi:heterodisulfide reductase subunit A-like polyferredoxin